MLNSSLNLLLNRLTAQIEKVMYQQNASSPTSLEKILRELSFLYSSANKIRRKLYKEEILPIRRLPVPVISIGNLAVGGTGKTPMTIHLAKLLQKHHYRPAVISRGYGGTAEKKGEIVSNEDTVLIDSKQAGDEPVMMARQLPGVPVIIGQNRFKSGKLAVEKFGCNVVVLDDGFQHL
ncbi:MAG: tetraacyldisaccharide 4'-kinase, partial [Desulfobacteraceae bacterium]